MTRARVALMLGCAAAVGCGASTGDARGCRPHPGVAHASADRPTIILVTIDGAIAADVLDSANMPGLHALAEHGVALGGDGAPMVASGPRYVSLPGYREILTGRRGNRCVDNECPRVDEPTLLDELRVADGPDAGDVAVVASWEVIDRAATADVGSLALSAGRHGGRARAALAVSDAVRADLARGAHASAWPGHGDYRPDAFTAALALDVVTAARPRVLWVALGDADEFAHRGDRAGYLAALGAADRLIARLVATIGLEHALFLVTADHGRAANFRDHGDAPESRGVWLVAAGASIPARGFVRTQALYRLADIAPTVRALVHLGADESARAGHPIAEMVEATALMATAR